MVSSLRKNTDFHNLKTFPNSLSAMEILSTFRISTSNQWEYFEHYFGVMCNDVT